MTTLIGALLKAQSEMKNPPLDGVNPHFKSKFSTLKAVREAVVPVLNKHGIVVWQSIENVDGNMVLSTRIAKAGSTIGKDESDEVMLVSQIVLPTGDMQKLGSAITYARRYSLLSLGALVGDPDDDGNEAVEMHYITSHQADEIHELIKATGSDKAKFLNYYKVDAVDRMTPRDYEHASKALSAKLDKEGEGDEQPE